VILAGWAALAAARPEPPPPEVPDHVERARAGVDWEIAEREAVRVLSDYLRVDTVNPPGNEDRGVAFLGALLDAEGIPWERVELEPGRASLIARVTGAGKAPPLCLMHHIDVVSSEADRWPAQTGPLSGAVADGYVWGRGALDMKGMGVLELLVAAWLVRLEVPLDRDVVLLAVADEEVDNLGAKQLAQPEVWARIGCDHLLNEGGIGVRDALFEGQAVHAISVAEKGTLWVDLVAEGRAGHGSVPVPDEEAPHRLLEAMRAMDRYRPKYRVDDVVYELLAEIGDHRGGFVGAVLKSRLGVRTLAWRKLKRNPTTEATIHDTVHLTGVRGAQAPNVVPSEVVAQYDCRLLPGTAPEAHLARLQELVRKEEGVRLEVVHQAAANRSPVDDPLYRIVAQYAVEGRPEAVAGPLLSVGFTDSILLRPLGVAAYGYVPFEVEAEVAETMHGHGERVPVDQVGEGLRRLFSMVVAFAGTPGGGA
jgi:acetylornithine deacetylase/succinyl-diaminopimelate desuccinylase-like protein